MNKNIQGDFQICISVPLRKQYLHNYVMAMKEKFKNLLRLSMLQAAEIKEQINDGDMAELQELNEKICRLLRKLESMVETIQEEMLDEDKPLEEIKTWMSAQKEHLNEIKNVKTRVKSKIMEKKEEIKLEELNHEMERQKIMKKLWNISSRNKGSWMNQQNSE